MFPEPVTRSVHTRGVVVERLGVELLGRILLLSVPGVFLPVVTSIAMKAVFPAVLG